MTPRKQLNVSHLNQSLSQRVAALLENAILEGQYEPGQRLYELEIAKSMNISRSPVREAFFILQSKGLLSTLPRKGTFIPQITRQGVKNTLDVRRALDGLAARLAAINATPDHLEEMKDLLIQQEIAGESKKKSKFHELAQNFHLTIYSASDNAKLVSLWENIRPEMMLYRITSISLPSRMEESLEEHKIILNSLYAHDPVLAQRVAEQHIDNFQNRLLPELHNSVR
jgi:DNA-binding GntR family transcriptional regulator